MSILRNIRHDVSLHNFTVYAQWASFSAIVVCWLRGAWFLILEFPHHRWTQFSYFTNALQVLNVFLFPIAPAAVIMPYMSKYNYYFLWVGLSWWYLLPFAWLFTNKINAELGIYIVLYSLVDMIVFRLTVIIMTPQKRLCTFLFHVAFTLWSSLWIGEPQLVWFGTLSRKGFIIRPHFEWPVVLAALATILYWVAHLRGDDIVYSKTLGGPGIKPMSLTLHSSEPEYNAIVDEGRIQLT